MALIFLTSFVAWISHISSIGVPQSQTMLSHSRDVCQCECVPIACPSKKKLCLSLRASRNNGFDVVFVSANVFPLQVPTKKVVFVTSHEIQCRVFLCQMAHILDPPREEDNLPFDNLRKWCGCPKDGLNSPFPKPPKWVHIEVNHQTPLLVEFHDGAGQVHAMFNPNNIDAFYLHMSHVKECPRSDARLFN